MTTQPPDVMENSFRVGFTGTQEGVTDQQRSLLSFVLSELWALVKLNPTHTVAVHGDCIGADKTFFDLSKKWHYITVARPGCDKTGESPKRVYTKSDFIYPTEPYLDRNRKIVEVSSCVIGCPKFYGEEIRSGTWATIRHTRKLERPLLVIYPNGDFQEENSNKSFWGL